MKELEILNKQYKTQQMQQCVDVKKAFKREDQRKVSEYQLPVGRDEGNSDNSITSSKSKLSYPDTLCPEREELEKVKMEIVIKEEKVEATEELLISEECVADENTRMSLKDVRLPRLSDSQDQVKVKDETGNSYLEEGSWKESFSKPGNTIKRTLSSSDTDQDSQGSPLSRVKVVKQARIFASSGEENDDEGRDNRGYATVDDGMPDGVTIDKYLEMWDVVYPMVSRKESLEIFQASLWNVKNTMIELGKLDKQYKAQQRKQREDAENARKKEAAEKGEMQRKLGLAKREQEISAQKSMKEKMRTQNELLKGSDMFQLVVDNTSSDRLSCSRHRLPTKMACSLQKALPLTQHQQEQLVSLIKDREATLTCRAFDPKARCWDEIAQLFNASYPEQEPRSAKQLKKSWEHIKRSIKIKAEKAAYVHLRRSTVAGPPESLTKYPQYLEMARSLMNKDLVMGGKSDIGAY